MKPSETKDESMQRAETQSPLRCSSPASSVDKTALWTVPWQQPVRSGKWMITLDLTALFQGGSAPRPALHHLGWPWLGAPTSDSPITCSCSCSPPILDSPGTAHSILSSPLHPYHTIDHRPGEKVLRPALHI